MNTLKTTLMAVLALMFVSSCDDPDILQPKASNLSSTTPDATEVRNKLLVSSGLRIAQFTEDGKNKTSLVNPYLFTFQADGTVKAVSANQTFTGTYRIFNDDNKTELAMAFPIGSLLHELTDDWYFLTHDQSMIRFANQGDVLQFYYP
jgi:hypothetical protein